MTFDAQSRRRIARTVKHFERLNLNTQPRSKKWPSAPPNGPRLCKPDATIAPNGSGTVSIWSGTPLADTGQNETAHLLWMHKNEAVSAGKECWIVWFPDLEKWVIMGAECED
jgi:hypothetical protein